MRHPCLRWTLFVTIALIGIHQSPAQQPPAASSKANLQQQMIQAEANRKALVLNNMWLSPQEERDFLPIYEDYRRAVAKLRERQIDLIIEYAQAHNAGPIPADKAGSLLSRAIALEEERNKLKPGYMAQTGKVLPAPARLRLYQVESRLDAEAQYSMFAQIPLAR